jgi:anti-sigma factor RsiW
MGMNHNRVGLLLSRYVDRELEDHERSGLESHLKDCASCREQLQEYQAVSSCLAIPAPIEAAPYLWTRTRQMVLDSSRQVGLMARLRPVLVPVAAAALVVIALVTGFQLTRTVSQGKRQAEIQAINPEFGDGTAPVLQEIVPPDTTNQDSLN